MFFLFLEEKCEWEPWWPVSCLISTANLTLHKAELGCVASLSYKYIRLCLLRGILNAFVSTRQLSIFIIFIYASFNSTVQRLNVKYKLFLLLIFRLIHSQLKSVRAIFFIWSKLYSWFTCIQNTKHIKSPLFVAWAGQVHLKTDLPTEKMFLVDSHQNNTTHDQAMETSLKGLDGRSSDRKLSL